MKSAQCLTDAETIHNIKYKGKHFTDFDLEGVKS